MKKDLTTTSLVLLAGALFALVSFLVFISLGKNKRFVNWKVRVGAWLITLTTIVNTGCPEPVVTCYDPIPIDYIEINENEVQGTLTINLKEDSEFNFNIYQPTTEEIYFVLKKDVEEFDSGSATFVSGSIQDGMIEYKVNLSSELLTGEYTFDLYFSDARNNLIMSVIVNILND